MRVDDNIKRTVVFVGEQHGSDFHPHGTGFIVANAIDGYSFQTVVTAKHLIAPLLARDAKICLRVNTHEKGAMVVHTKSEDWHNHPDHRVDICVCPTLMQGGIFDLLHLDLDGPIILTPEKVQERNIGIGNTVAIAGMYIQKIGETVNIPIVRVGTIAAMPEEKLRSEYGYHDAYLIEMRSLGGLSGSPVFVSLDPWKVNFENGQVSMETGHLEYLLGMLLGHTGLQDKRDEVEIRNPNAKPGEETTTVQIAQNTGIGIVVPIADVKVAVEQPKISDRRREQVIKRKQENR